MPVELKIPQAGESITEVEIGEWIKAEGDWVAQDDPVVVIETEKATVELPAPVSGTVSRIVKKKGERASVGDVIGYMEESERPVEQKAGKEAGASGRPQAEEKAAQQAEKKKISEEARAPAPRRPEVEKKAERGSEKIRVMPAARRVLAEHGLKAEEVQAGGPGERLLKEDVLRHIEGGEAGKEEREATRVPKEISMDDSGRREEAVPMSLLRRRIAERLVEAQKNAALLTTFNEIDMAAVVALRKKHREVFQQKHGIKLGFMSFFVKAAIEALKLIPQVNAEVRGDNIIYRNYYDIGIAVGGGKGLVVPVLRSAERMSFAGIERAIGDFSRRAQENKLKVEELQGGTFTISNGGIYGSLLSTPIVNPPQSGVLGLHAIQERPVVRGGEVAIRPMMYVALTYDHRIIDGREAVTFLRHIKELIEEPARILLEI